MALARSPRVSESNARRESFDVDDATVNIRSMPEAVTAVITAARREEGACLFTLNLDHCTKLRSDWQFRAAYRRAKFITADGFPIVFLGRLNGVSLSRTTGSDMVWPLCEEAARHKVPIFLFGASMPVLRKAQLQMLKRLPGIDIVGIHAPPPAFDPGSAEADRAMELIRRSGARLCIVALGAPRQEVFAARCLDAVPGVTFVCLGAGLDFVAGTQTRAPQFFRDRGLEWLWRLMSNPRRLGLRYLKCAGAVPRLAAEAIPHAISIRMGRPS